MSLEFRVRWQREGRQPSYRIYQTWDAACRKVCGIKALEQFKDDTSRFATLPNLTGPPTLQVREVGAWQDHDYQPKAEDHDVRNMREWVSYREPEQDWGPMNQEDAGLPF